MVGMVLTGNGITAYGNGAYSPISGSVKYRFTDAPRAAASAAGRTSTSGH
ncbi:hypothetical protein IQ216_12235 [Cyanobium sp. LEGE 06143]|nr:hypothetical protein [Cyanobium sp. LEGE 06143]MBE9173809.1 hypothetical protein [Cyanobium sp. LEGE 06143]